MTYYEWLSVYGDKWPVWFGGLDKWMSEDPEDNDTHAFIELTEELRQATMLEE